jgi:hypothetical protein
MPHVHLSRRREASTTPQGTEIPIEGAKTHLLRHTDPSASVVRGLAVVFWAGVDAGRDGNDR